MIVITIYLSNINYYTEDEQIVIKTSAGVKRLFLGIDKAPEKNELLFINTSYDNQLVEYSDDSGTGTIKITDRKKLYKLLHILNSKPGTHKFLMCDIYFEESSMYDSILSYELSQMKNVVIGYRLPHAKTLPLLSEIPKGLIHYNIINNTFLKYDLMVTDSLKSLPLRMYELINSISFDKCGPLLYGGNTTFLNSIITDFPIRKIEFFPTDTAKRYPILNLNQVSDTLLYSSKEILDLAKDKIIVVGDLIETDKHSTIFGEIHGALIMLNVYYNIVYMYSSLNGGRYLVIFLLYFLLSLTLFSNFVFLKKVNTYLIKMPVLKFVTQNVKYYVMLGIITIITYSMYGLHIKIFFLVVYLDIVFHFSKKLTKPNKSK
jgi:hypothetical protein